MSQAPRTQRGLFSICAKERPRRSEEIARGQGPTHRAQAAYRDSLSQVITARCPMSHRAVLL